MTARQVNRDGKINQNTIVRQFGSFSEALIQAGLKPIRTYKPNHERMLSELATLVSKLGRPPSKTEITRNLNYNARHYEREFSGVDAAIDLAKRRASDRRHETLEAPRSTPTASRRTPSRGKTRRKYGPAIDVRGLRHAPINENGVIFLFGVLAEELGFAVESIQNGFPDCDAKLKQKDGTFEGVRIEVEFQSSSFLRHGHDPAKCDLIVCWEHDWPECPIEVMALSRVIPERSARE